MNAHSPIEKPYCQTRKNVKPFQELIEIYELIVNNDTNYTIHLVSQKKTCFIDFVPSSSELRPLGL